MTYHETPEQFKIARLEMELAAMKNTMKEMTELSKENNATIGKLQRNLKKKTIDFNNLKKEFIDSMDEEGRLVDKLRKKCNDIQNEKERIVCGLVDEYNKLLQEKTKCEASLVLAQSELHKTSTDESACKIQEEDNKTSINTDVCSHFENDNASSNSSDSNSSDYSSSESTFDHRSHLNSPVSSFGSNSTVYNSSVCRCESTVCDCLESIHHSEQHPRVFYHENARASPEELEFIDNIITETIDYIDDCLMAPRTTTEKMDFFKSDKTTDVWPSSFDSAVTAIFVGDESSVNGVQREGKEEVEEIFSFEETQGRDEDEAEERVSLAEDLHQEKDEASERSSLAEDTRVEDKEEVKEVEGKSSSSEDIDSDSDDDEETSGWKAEGWLAFAARARVEEFDDKWGAAARQGAALLQYDTNP